MRDPTTDKTEKARVTAAIKEAWGLLLPLRRVSWGNPNNDPGLEFEAAVGFIDALLQALQDQALSQKDIRSWIGSARKHAIPVLRQGGRPPKRQQRGQPPQTFRDRLIAEAVNRICQCGFNPTRNPGTTERKSASWIILRALGKLGIKLSEGRVAAIWAKYNRRV
jgi:hypothetical protein